MEKSNPPKTSNLSDKVELFAQIGSMVFGIVFTTMQIVKAVHGDEQKGIA